MKYRDPSTGEFKELYAKAADTLPVGTVVDFDGDEAPAGWEEVGSDTYSTEEVFTGKYWIDGKKIYRKSYNRTVPTTNGAILSNIETVVNYNFFVQSIYSNTYPIPYYSPYSEKYNTGINLLYNEVRIELGEHYNTNCGFMGFIEYTKTTD